MKVYHGSYTLIETVDFSFCRKRRDFGRGFYVTKILSQAEYWAARKGDDNDTEGVVTEFDFDECFFEDGDLKTLRFTAYSDEWLDFVALNRLNRGNQQVHDCDIVEGPVADDDIAARVYDYVKGKVSKEQFLNELSMKTPTHQVCFCTMRSLQALELNKDKIDVETVHTDNDIVKSIMTDYGITEMEAAGMYFKSETFTRLADENNCLYLKPWQEIYQMLKNELRN